MSGREAEELGISGDYGIESLGGSTRRGDPEHQRELREHYGYLRARFKGRPEKYGELQRALNQAQMSQTYDEYLTTSAYYALGGALLGLLVGGLVTFLLVNTGILVDLRSPVANPGEVGSWIGANRVLVAGVVLSIVGMLAVGGGIWLTRTRYPSLVVGQRRRSIDVTLPHAIVFMYALSHGGMGLYGVIKDLADADDAYGEVAREFQTVVRDVELFGSDLYTALRNARNLTPSENLEQFLDDMLSVLDSGGDITIFFEDEADNYLDEAESEQERFLETLSLLSEVFVVGFVAAPLFIIVILLVMSLLGASTLLQLGLIVYVMLPLGMLGYLTLVDYLSTPYKPEKVDLDREREDPDGSSYAPLLVARDILVDAWTALGRLGARLNAAVHRRPYEPPTLTPTERLEQDHYRYRRRRHRQDFKAFLRRPLVAIRQRPDLSVAVTAPLAFLAMLVVVLTGTASPTLEALFEAPVSTTIWLGVIPLLIVGVPLSYFYERRRYRQASIAKRFPDTLNILSSANRMGIQFIDALGLISRWSSGPIAHELRLVRNDIQWNHDPRAALRAFADRLGTPQLSRTVRLISGGLRSSGDLSRILSVAAEDTRSRYRMARKRRQELSSYTAVVVIGFLVYLLVIILLSQHYLEPVASAPVPDNIDGVAVPFSFASLDVDVYTALFFHSAVIQAIGSGLLAGKLVNNSVRSGLKYSIVLTLVAVATFALI
jgi:flagellar protein FlaJ